MIDHLVLATPDVPATVAELRATWGIELTPGGSHVGRGTRNELTGLGGATYLEVVGPDPAQPEPPFQRPFGVDALRTGSLVAWCARPSRPLPHVLAAIGALGMDLGEALEMSRARPDGVLLEWQLTFPVLGSPHVGTVPFLIDWLDSPHPAGDLPHDATLTQLRITHPAADLLVAVLAEIGASPLVEVSSGPVSLSASVLTPRGVVTL